MANILVLEDLEENFHLIRNALDPEHNLTWAQTVADAKQKFDGNFQLALVDIQLPDGDGFQFCDWIRSKAGDANIPIVFISANSSVESRITGFMIGGDDYVSRPFNFVELRARIEAKLRRASKKDNIVLEAAGIYADLRSQKAHAVELGKPIEFDLTPIEFKILNLFLNEPNKAFGRDEILNKVWGRNIFVYPRSVDAHVSKLKKKLGSKGTSIQSVHGIGYKLVS